MASKSTAPDLGQLAAEELRTLVAELQLQLQALREENAALRDEIARLEGLKARPKLRPSGMAPATAATVRGRRGRTQRGRGAKASERVSAEERAGAHHGAAAGRAVQGLHRLLGAGAAAGAGGDPLPARALAHRRRAQPGRAVAAWDRRPLRAGAAPRFVLVRHHQGQVTAERLTRLLNELGLAASKRRVPRLPNDDREVFAAEAAAVLGAGLETARRLTADDTGARGTGRGPG